MISKLLHFKFREQAETWIARLPELSKSQLETVEERIVTEETLESLFEGILLL